MRVCSLVTFPFLVEDGREFEGLSRLGDWCGTVRVGDLCALIKKLTGQLIPPMEWETSATLAAVAAWCAIDHVKAFLFDLVAICSPEALSSNSSASVSPQSELPRSRVSGPLPSHSLSITSTLLSAGRGGYSLVPAVRIRLCRHS